MLIIHCSVDFFGIAQLIIQIRYFDIFFMPTEAWCVGTIGSFKQCELHFQCDIDYPQLSTNRARHAICNRQTG